VIGRPRSRVRRAPTPRDPKRFVARLARRIRALLKTSDAGPCQGVGVVVPGMVDHVTGRVLHAPTLGWQNVDIREPLARAIGLPVHIENSGRACALAQSWEARNLAAPVGDLVYVSVSDGVGVGVMINGELVRGRHNIAGEFAHMPLSLDGPRCSCGAHGCWEAYISNLATLSRYGGRTSSIVDLIARARDGDARAMAALQTTARYLGLGLSAIANTVNPGTIYIGGEITTAWDLIDATVRSAMKERALIPAAAATILVTVSAGDLPRLRGAAMLVAAPVFAAPVVA
jgi:predicted NBD/HSP70 family sugar kinase